MSNTDRIEHSSAGTMFSGPSAVNIFRMEMILRGLKFEQKFPGARLTRKAPKCSTIVRREYGLKGNHAKLIAQFEPLVVAARAQVSEGSV